MSDLCFVEHDDWTGPHQRLGSCPDEIPTWVKWFINEDGEVYDYDARTQAVDFPNDDHRVFDTEEEAVLAAEISRGGDHETDPDPDGGGMEQMPYGEAISYAIFAINTFTEPGASSDGDIDRMLANSDQIIASLVDLRMAVHDLGMTVPTAGAIEAEIRRRLAEGE